jgi:hypothetical protein
LVSYLSQTLDTETKMKESGIHSPASKAFATPARPSQGFDRFDFLCTVALLLSFFAASRLPIVPSKYGDFYFHDEAREVAAGIRGFDHWDRIAIARAPGPVLYYAIPYLLVRPGSSNAVYWRAALAWNICWMLAALLLIRRTAELFWSSQAGRIAAIIFLLIPLPVYYSFGISAEPPAYAAAATFIYGWELSRLEFPKWRVGPRHLIALLGFTGLVLCRPNALIVVSIGVVSCAVLWLRHRKIGSADVRFALLCVASTVILVGGTSLVLSRFPRQHGMSTQASNFSIGQKNSWVSSGSGSLPSE